MTAELLTWGSGATVLKFASRVSLLLSWVPEPKNKIPKIKLKINGREGRNRTLFFPFFKSKFLALAPRVACFEL